MKQCGHERSAAAVTVTLAAGVLALCGPPGAAAQEPASLEGPTNAYAEPFSLIGGIRELDDGRVLVSIIDPELMLGVANVPALADVACDAKERLQRVANALG